MNKKNIITIFILMSVVIGAGIAYYFFRSENSGSVSSEDPEEIKRRQDYETAKKAALEKKIEYCYGLDPGRIDECIFAVAKNGNNTAVCDNIVEDGLRAECRESIAYDGIIEGENIKRCSELKIGKLYSQCLLSFFWKWDSPEKCSEAEEEDRADCMDIINKKRAYQDNDEGKCDDINDDSLKDDCFTVLKSKPKDSDGDELLDSDEISYGTNPYSADTDGDGLSDLEELKTYFTDPRAADTDNDGFSDGDEVRSGYNPKGDGKL